jgi:glycine betaine/proline transport system substrate-binding protein
MHGFQHATDYWADYGENLVVLGEAEWYNWFSCSLVTINSIEELNANKDKFKGESIGIGGGAGIHANTVKTIDLYGLDYEQITSNGSGVLIKQLEIKSGS